ncbi:MAG TPA: hypothetical protein VK041_02460 [Opitutales bacterium]|nr:hypothetical protein [Opitutales bacterium]
MIGFELIIQWTVFAIVALALAYRGQLTIFHPVTVYLAFHCIVFCIRPTLVYFFKFDTIWEYIGFWPTDDEMILALYLSSAGLVVFAAAFAAVSPYGAPRNFVKPRKFSLGEQRAFWATAVLLVPFGIYSIFGADMQGERVGGVYIMTGTTGYINDLQQVLIPITILIIVLCRWRWFSFLPLVVFLFYRTTQGWGRWTIILTIFALILFHTWHHRRSLPSFKYLLPLPLIMILFANLGLDRTYVQKKLEGNEEETRDVLDESETFESRFDTLDFANFDYLTYIVSVVPKKTENYTYASQYLQIFTEPIPRRFWKNKPVGPPIVVFDLNDYGDFNGLTPSLVGDGWMSGGWIGALLTMAIIGGALGWFYNWFIHNQDDIFSCFIFLITNAVIVQLFRDGGISIAKFLLFCLLPIFVWRFLAYHVFPDRDLAFPKEFIEIEPLDAHIVETPNPPPLSLNSKKTRL